MELSAVKIAKTATKKSIMDVTANLHVYETKENKSSEEIYKGKVVFSITEVHTRKYEKTWVDKATCKTVMHAMANGNFGTLYGDEGFVDYGGSKKNGVVRSRVFRIKANKKENGEIQYIFQIEEGPGKEGESGNITPLKGDGTQVTRVQTYVARLDAIKMAHEVYDYIRGEEITAIQNGKPLHTIMHFQKPDPAPAASAQVEETQTTGEYLIPYGKLKGTKMSDLTIAHLRYILEQASGNPILQELQTHAKAELERKTNSQ